MKRITSLFLALSGLIASGATGDITGVSIETNGIHALVYISGLSSNGTYALGLKAAPWLNSPVGRRVWLKTEKEAFRIQVASPGFNTNREPVTRLRWVTATTQTRHPYPNDGDIDEVYDGTTLRLRLTLDNPVYQGDTVGSAVVAAGLYTQGTASAATAGVGVTNNSALPYHKAIANWTWPGFNRETGSTMSLRAFGAAPFAREGLPLAGLDFIVQDESGVTTTNAAQFGFDPVLSTLDPYRNAEWWAAVPLSGFGITNSLRCDFRAFPWLGTTNEVLDTRNSAWAAPHPYPGSITNLCDRTDIYCDQIAVVDMGGNDTNGRTTNAAPASVNSAHYFLSIAGAANALANTNNTRHGHADPGGGKIYVRAGVTNWTGGTVSGNGLNVPKAWLEILPYPGDSVTLTNRSGTQDAGDRIKFSGVGGSMTWGFVGTGVPFNNVGALWGDRIVIDSTATAFWQGSAQVNVGYLTHSRVTNCTQGLVLYPGSTTYWALLRGNNLDGLNSQTTYFTMLGNYKTAVKGSNYILRTSTLNLSADWSILYNNKFLGHGGSSDVAVIGSTLTVTNGLVIAQNIWEYTSSNVNPNLVFIGTSQGVPSSNIMFFHNAVIGKRSGKAYNDSGTNSTPKWVWAQNNIDEIPGFKSDTFPFGGGNGNRTGNWQFQFGVGCFGNVYLNRNIDQAAGQFAPDFPGWASWYGSDLVNETNTVTWPRFQDDKGYIGSGFTVGGGDYKLKSDSPFINLNNGQDGWILKYDIDGNPRGANAPPGPYSVAVPLNGLMFH